ncbi:hypothetical protein A5717_11315 [Mycolicibacterium porcinum]|uniref:hypothetical protein n=1 Tax=Mycolicibacterium porcinum TaxID=39693 RepID=UPI00080BAA8F|nr:hypothetical protein [Mycolicibacterium porcinum]OCB14102.1 hypothetical protein A5717_11315 [Mycolicibacterium porcinum]
MPVLSFPEPGGWRSGRTFAGLAGVIACCVVILYVFLGAAAATRGNYLTMVVAFGWAVFVLAAMLALLLVGLGRTEARITSDASGFTMWPDRRFSILMVAGVVASIPSTLMFAIFAPSGAIEFANTRGLQTIGSVFAAVVVVIAVVGLIRAWGRGGVGHVKLTPGMVENADIMSTRMFEWDDVVDVTDHAKSRKVRHAVVLRLRNGREEIISSADIYLPRGAALYWMMRHYWKHPEDRMELADSRAPERLRDGRFDFG